MNGQMYTNPVIIKKHFLNVPLVYKLGTRFVGYFPKKLAYFFAGLIAEISVILYRTSFNIVSNNLKTVFKEYSEDKIKGITREIFRNYAKYLVDYGRYTNMEKEKIMKEIVSYQGKENLKKAVSMRKGVILVTGHLGNWELGGLFLSSFGLKINVITSPDENPDIHKIRQQYREKFDINTITIGNNPSSSVDMINVLNRGEVLAMLIDRYDKNEGGVQCDFFGKQRIFPIGPIVLARITGSPLIVSFVVKEKYGYKGIIEKPIIVNAKQDESASLKRIVSILEKYIIIYANQWYNFCPI